jgi:hypothetical protein
VALVAFIRLAVPIRGPFTVFALIGIAVLSFLLVASTRVRTLLV